MLRIEGKRTKLARRLRHNPTLAERLLWAQLRDRRLLGLRFRRQEPMGNYIVDFVCHEVKLVIGADGSQHCDNPKDLERTAWLEKRGYKVLRFWNNEIQKHMEGVIEMIMETVREEEPLAPPPCPSPAKAGEGTLVASCPANTSCYPYINLLNT